MTCLRSSTSVRERYAQITAKLASDLLDQFHTSNVAVLESKAAPLKIAPSTITKTRDIGVQTEPELIPLSKRGSSSGTAMEDVSSIVNLQNAVAQLQAQLAQHEAELVRAHSTARALEANLHQREVRVRKLEAEYDKLRAEKVRLPLVRVCGRFPSYVLSLIGYVSLESLPPGNRPRYGHGNPPECKCRGRKAARGDTQLSSAFQSVVPKYQERGRKKGQGPS